MVEAIRTNSTQEKDATHSSVPVKLIQINYNKNTDSDYTEKIQELDRQFKYSENSQESWNNPEYSFLYGTPLYLESTESQKIALNHLYWYLMYHFIATSEHQTIIYNTITAGVFKKIKGYEIIGETLDLESKQEISHIHAFRKICYQLIKALLGKDAFKETLKPNTNQGYAEKISEQIGKWKQSAGRFLIDQMLRSHQDCYSEYLRELEAQDKVPSFRTGFIGEGMGYNQDLIQFFSQNWGRTPFLACNYYTLRYIANMGLKHTEHSSSRYYKELEKKGAKIPVPTAISYYHFLDESFHTSTSRFIARELYRDFPNPSPYEKIVANLAFYQQQRFFLNGLSAIMPDKHRADNLSIMGFMYKILQSPIFGMDKAETLNQMEKCLCQEHEGLHFNYKLNQSTLLEFRRTYSKVDYLWPVNKQMQLMAKNGSIGSALERNRQTFQKFQKMV